MSPILQVPLPLYASDVGYPLSPACIPHPTCLNIWHTADQT